MSMLAERKVKKKWSLDPRGKAWSEDSNKFGQKLLEKMGWAQGKGLGARENGIVEHVKVPFKNDTTGIGFKERNDQWTEHDTNFNSLLQALTGDTQIEHTTTRVSLEKKSQSSRVRVHYKKFTSGKDLSRYSDKDLANIFGKKSLTDMRTGPVEEAGFTRNGGSMMDYFKKKLPNFGKRDGFVVGSNGVLKKEVAEDEDERGEERKRRFDGDNELNGTSKRIKHGEENGLSNPAFDPHFNGTDLQNGSSNFTSEDQASVERECDHTKRKKKKKDKRSKNDAVEEEKEQKQNGLTNPAFDPLFKQIAAQKITPNSIREENEEMDRTSLHQKESDDSIAETTHKKKKNNKRKDKTVEEEKEREEMIGLSNPAFDPLFKSVEVRKSGLNTITEENEDTIDDGSTNQKEIDDRIVNITQKKKKSKEMEAVDEENEKVVSGEETESYKKKKKKTRTVGCQQNGFKAREEKDEDISIEHWLDNDSGESNNLALEVVKKTKKKKESRQGSANPAFTEQGDESGSKKRKYVPDQTGFEVKRKRKNREGNIQSASAEDKREDNLSDERETVEIRNKTATELVLESQDSQNPNLEFGDKTKIKQKKTKEVLALDNAAFVDQNQEEMCDFMLNVTTTPIANSHFEVKRKKKKSEATTLEESATEAVKRKDDSGDGPISETVKRKKKTMAEEIGLEIQDLQSPNLDSGDKKKRKQRKTKEVFALDNAAFEDQNQKGVCDFMLNVTTTSSHFEVKRKKKKTENTTREGLASEAVKIDDNSISNTPKRKKKAATEEIVLGSQDSQNPGLESGDKRKRKQKKSKEVFALDNAAFVDQNQEEACDFMLNVTTTSVESSCFEVKRKKKKAEDSTREETVSETVRIEDDSGDDPASKTLKRKKKQTTEELVLESQDSQNPSLDSGDKWKKNQAKRKEVFALDNEAFEDQSQEEECDLMLNVTSIVKKTETKKKSVRFSDTHEEFLFPRDEAIENGDLETNINEMSRKIEDFQAEIENDINAVKAETMTASAAQRPGPGLEGYPSFSEEPRPGYMPQNDGTGDCSGFPTLTSVVLDHTRLEAEPGHVKLNFRQARFNRTPRYMLKGTTTAKTSIRPLIRGDIILGFESTNLHQIPGYGTPLPPCASRQKM